MVIYSPSALIGTAVALPLLGVIAVALRFYVRLHLRHTFLGADDWLVLASVFLVVGAHGVIQILMTVYGVAGQDELTPKQYDKTRLAFHQKASHAIVVIEKFTYTFIKLSVLFLYRRIFGAGKTFRRICDALSVVMVLWCLVFTFVEAFECVSDGGANTTCAAQEWTLLWFAITEILSDIVILSLPYHPLRKLQMNRRDKVGLAAIFALGTISTLTGVVRLGYVAKNFHLYFSPDQFNDTASAPGFWTTAEVSIGVLAACLPPLGPLLRRVPTPSKVYYAVRSGLLSSRASGGRRSQKDQAVQAAFTTTEKSAGSDSTVSSVARATAAASLEEQRAKPSSSAESDGTLVDSRPGEAALLSVPGRATQVMKENGGTWFRDPTPDGRFDRGTEAGHMA